jgi:hypothetical protein
MRKMRRANENHGGLPPVLDLLLLLRPRVRHLFGSDQIKHHLLEDKPAYMQAAAVAYY